MRKVAQCFGYYSLCYEACGGVKKYTRGPLRSRNVRGGLKGSMPGFRPTKL